MNRTPPVPPPPARRRARRTALALGLGSALLVLMPWWAGWLQPVETVAMSLAMRLRGPRPPQPDVVVVAIDAASIDRLGRWPWPRDCVGGLIERLSAAGARTVALDVVFSEPTRSPPGVDLSGQDAALASAMQRAGNVVGGFFLRPRPVGGEATPAAPAAASTEPPTAVPPTAVPPTAVPPTAVSPAAVPSTAAVPSACAAPSARLADPVSGWLRVTGGPYRLKTAVEVEPNLAMFDAAAVRQGFFSHERQQGVQQRYDLATRLERAPAAAGGDRSLVYPALALAAVAEYRGVRAAVGRGQGEVPVIELGGETVETDEELRLWLDYAGPAGTYPAVPAWELLAHPPEALAPRLAGKLVFVGATETGIGDLASTPFGEMPGVEVHANAAGNLLSGRYIRDGAVQLAASLAALVALTSSSPGWCTPSSATWWARCWPSPPCCCGRWAVSPPSSPSAGTSTPCRRCSPAPSRWCRRCATRSAPSRRGRGASRVSSGATCRRRWSRSCCAASASSSAARSATMTVLFSDIRGFTDMSEHLDSTAVVALLNEFFTPMTRLVLDHGGTLDKYMGDAMMAFFGAPLEQPDHAARGAAAALAMRAELVHLNERLAGRGAARRGQVDRHRHRPQQRRDDGRQHGLRRRLRLHGDRRRGEPRLAHRGPQQGLRHPGAGLRRHRGADRRTASCCASSTACGSRARARRWRSTS